MLHLNFWPHIYSKFPNLLASQRNTESHIMESAQAAHAYCSNVTQAITMDTSVVHHGNMTWMSMIEVNGFAVIKGASILLGIHTYTLYTSKPCLLLA